MPVFGVKINRKMVNDENRVYDEQPASDRGKNRWNWIFRENINSKINILNFEAQFLIILNLKILQVSKSYVMDLDIVTKVKPIGNENNS